jgi:hypothetical protein
VFHANHASVVLVRGAAENSIEGVVAAESVSALFATADIGELTASVSPVFAVDVIAEAPASTGVAAATGVLLHNVRPHLHKRNFA